jgi:hypothetical protein
MQGIAMTVMFGNFHFKSNGKSIDKKLTESLIGQEESF